MNTNKRILIVDSHSTMLRIIRNLLEQIGFKDIDESTDVESALEKFKVEDYGLVMSEWDIEGGSGYDFLKSIRGGDHNNQAPFIMLTAESNTANVIKAKEAGVSNFIVKPFNAETLKNKIRSAIA